MTINRNNYEEYFLLYVDNELSAAEKNIVEVFVKENPDLQEEMLMLQQSILKPEAVLFLNKESLLKPRAVVDAGTKEKLLLLLDGELTGKEKQQLLGLIGSNKEIKEEWQLLQQTKLSPADEIIFEDKASLYKKERTRVITVRWWQMAAAAMLVGFGLWGTVSYLNKNGHITAPLETVSNNGNIKPANSSGVPEPGVKDTSQNIAEIKMDDKIAVTVATPTKQKKIIPVKTPGTVNKNANLALIPQDDKTNTGIAQQTIKNDYIPKADLKNFNNDAGNYKDVANVTPQINKDKIEGQESVTQPINTYAINISAEENNETSVGFEDDDDKSKKSKLGGFFKKVKRVLERKTNIRTGNSDDIKIANMSFAMH